MASGHFTNSQEPDCRWWRALFYHQLHIVQLRVMHQLTNLAVFAQTAHRWEEYSRNRLNRARALAHKSIFKLCYY